MFVSSRDLFLFVWTVAKIDLLHFGRDFFVFDRFGCLSNREVMSFVLLSFYNVLVKVSVRLRGQLCSSLQLMTLWKELDVGTANVSSNSDSCHGSLLESYDK